MSGRGSRRRSALGRSFDIYYRDTARTERMDSLNAHFVHRGATVFDIGAHVGDRTGSFLRLGAAVVALEPQPQVYRALRLIHGKNEAATLLPFAAGAEAGEIVLHLNSRNPTVATVDGSFVAAAAAAPGWRDQTWDGRVTVPVTTLDTLIDEFGLPDFVKIDVEGHEAAVLRGLSVALPALSFEMTTMQRGAAHAAIARLCALGRYEFNLSLGEAHAFDHPTWLDADAAHTLVDALPEGANSGDIYARTR